VLYGNSDVEINCIILLLNSRLTMLLRSLSHVFIVGSNAGLTTLRGKVEEYWLSTPFACYPFTSPPVRHLAPPGFKRAIPIYQTTTRHTTADRNLRPASTTHPKF